MKVSKSAAMSSIVDQTDIDRNSVYESEVVRIDTDQDRHARFEF